MTERIPLAVAILSGGEGTRIGGDKPLIMLRGKTLLGRAYARARAWSDLTVLVLRSAEQMGKVDYPWIIDMPGIDGPLAGLAAAFGWARVEGAGLVLTIPCDMPFLPYDLPFRLLAAIDQHGTALASSNGRLHPVCGLWRTDRLDQLAQYWLSGRSSLTGFAAEIGHVAVDWPASPHDPFFNINSHEDLIAAEEIPIS